MITAHHNIFGKRYNATTSLLTNLIAYWSLDSNADDKDLQHRVI